MRKVLILLFFFLFTLSSLTFSQRPQSHSASEIEMMLDKLNVLGTALYMAAHPDDENTRLITYLSKDRKMYTAYLSLTRGDGGQNSIGPEIREELGMIRTQELLAARGIDGGQQFFVRAIDFGYSKTSEETFTKWGREELLSDVVWVIRKFKPDVIINRFPPNSNAGHGQHQASAILSIEAFKLAADPNAFPEQLKYVEPWQPKRIFLNTGRWWNPDITDDSDSVISVNIGAYNPVLGKSYSEIAAESRSQHKSQSFGVSSSRGYQPEYLELIDGTLAKSDLAEGIDMSWSRLGSEYSFLKEKVNRIKSKFDFRNPSGIVPDLIDLRKEIESISNEFWKKRKLGEVDVLIKACMGLYFEAVTHEKSVVPGDSVYLHVEVINRSDIPATITGLSSATLRSDTLLQRNLEENIGIELIWPAVLPDGAPYTIPYWLEKQSKGELYNVSDQNKIGQPMSEPALKVDFKIEVLGETLNYHFPVVYKWNDHIKGEQYEPLEIIPPVFVSLSEKSYVFANGGDKEITLTVKAGHDSVSGQLQLNHPEGWQSSPEKQNFKLGQKGEEQSFIFTLQPPPSASDATLEAQAVVDGKVFNRDVYVIDYPHIPVKNTYPFAQSKIVKIELDKGINTKIGYIEGAGDDVAASLAQIGYEVTMLNESNMEQTDFSQFDAIVVGIMAFNNLPYLQQYHDALLEYVNNGGNLVVQYNNIRIGMKADIPMPYPIEFTRRSSQCRVSVEDAPVEILAPNHPVMNQPNQITTPDFNGWVQERGLYFPIEWDDNYTAILSSHDPGEDPLNGGLLVAPYGKGNYVYTAYSWFRQLPAGVPGAYRIIANIISLETSSGQKQ
jgi:LmbE family N-acetylglucosaminyl deacetylase